MIYKLRDLNETLKEKYKTELTGIAETERLKVFLKNKVIVDLELGRERNEMTKKVFKERTEELLKIIEIASKTVPLNTQIYFDGEASNYKNKQKEDMITFRIGGLYYRKRESKVEQTVLKYFLRKEFAKKRF